MLREGRKVRERSSNLLDLSLLELPQDAPRTNVDVCTQATCYRLRAKHKLTEDQQPLA